MKRRILLVEDDAFFARIYASRLETEGFDVSLATNGDDALKLAEKDAPALILLDLRLQPQKMDGFGLLVALKKHPSLARIPAVVFTNLGQKEDIERCFELGCAGYLIKAHTMPHEVVKKIKELLHADV